MAKYTFNRGSVKDEAGHNDGRAVSASLDDDRFGNPNSSYYLHGAEGSYLSLGISPVLKPSIGSISLWFKLDIPCEAGVGYEMNPIIMTKCTDKNDFYEAYWIYYHWPEKRLIAGNTKPGSPQANMHSTHVMRHKWYHVVLTYDDSQCSLYLNGKLDMTLQKKFHSTFLATDSVILGNSFNAKNNRFFNGNLDDLEIYDRVLSPEEVKELYEAPNPSRRQHVLNIIYVVLAVIAGICIITWFLNRRFKKRLEKEKEKSKIYDMEMRVMKAQMNPHFMFNALNSIQQLITTQETEKAQMYLSKFSKLIRKLLESNTEDDVLVADEVELLERYLEIESLRFNNAFSYTITVDQAIHAELTRIPHFLIQPLAENAVWHGLLRKKGEKRLSINFTPLDEHTLLCSIDDNGIGRSFKANEKDTRRSLGLSFVRQRLELFGRIYQRHYTIEIIDKNEGGMAAGTTVRVQLPIIKQ